MTSWDSPSSVEPEPISGLLHKATSLEFPGSRSPLNEPGGQRRTLATQRADRSDLIERMV